MLLHFIVPVSPFKSSAVTVCDVVSPFNNSISPVVIAIPTFSFTSPVWLIVNIYPSFFTVHGKSSFSDFVTITPVIFASSVWSISLSKLVSKLLLIFAASTANSICSFKLAFSVCVFFLAHF